MHSFLNGLLTLAIQDSATSTAEKSDAAEAVNTATTAAAEAAGAAEAASGGSGLGSFLLLIGALALIIMPFVIGQLLANAMRVKEWGFRIGVCLFAVVMSVAPFVSAFVTGRPLEDTLRLGIDLKGGTNIVFKVQGEGKQVTSAIMDKMVGAVAKRINPSGTEEITVRQVGSDRIEVIVPGEDPQAVDEIKRRITKLGSLDFFIAANPVEDSDIVKQAMQLGKDTSELLDAFNNPIAIWRLAAEKDNQPKLLNDSSIVSRPVERLRTVNGKTEKYNTEEYLLLVDPPEERVTGKYLTSSSPGFGPDGKIIVNFSFNQRGGFLFQQLTSRNLPRPGGQTRRLAILLDRQVYSAPSIKTVIADRGFIEGGINGFSREEAEELTDVLNAGALEVPIDPKPLSEATVDPTLGADVRRSGVQSVLLGGLCVVGFMILYYRLAGLVAVICVVLNLVLVVSIMVMINATFTLPGLAGLVLSIAMAVDANVLIYERMREDLSRGSSLRMAIHNGFDKAFGPIVDSNVTTLLSAVVLFMIGTDTVKGFAVTLFIGITVSMFTALYVGRLLFDLIEKRRIATTLTMMNAVGVTNFDFLGKSRLCAGLSITSIVIGMLVFFVRGQQNYDIDFTGGTMVTFQLKEEARTDDVRKALGSQFTDSFSLERLSIAGEKTEGIGKHFRLRTTESDTEENADEKTSAEERVREKVFKSFEGESSMHLRMVGMEFGEISPIKIAADDESAEALSLKKFDGGSKAELKMTEEVAAGTIGDMLSASLMKLKSGDAPKYPEPEALFAIEGTAGSGIQASELQVRKYDGVAVRTVAALPAEDLKMALDDMQKTLAESPLFDEVNTFTSAVASEMKGNALLAIILTNLAIIAYIWFRFQNVTFGIAAVVALVHDVLITLGALAVVSYLNNTAIGDLLLIEDFRINLPLIAAFLTLVGYSLNDTIVVFDRIREVRGKNPMVTVQMVNDSLNQTLSRTLLTSTATFLVCIVLYVMGGEGIHGFAFCLFVGIIVGTYSSVYVASPVMLWLMNREAAAKA